MIRNSGCRLWMSRFDGKPFPVILSQIIRLLALQHAVNHGFTARKSILIGFGDRDLGRTRILDDIEYRDVAVVFSFAISFNRYDQFGF